MRRNKPEIHFGIRWRLTYLYICTLVIFVSVVAFTKPIEEKNPKKTSKQGLVGLIYDDTNLTRLQSIWYIDFLNSAETDWPDKNDFSAKLQGYIQFPVSGTIVIRAEADNGLLLQIRGETILDGWENGLNVHGKIVVEKDKLYPIYIAYRQLNGTSFMRVYWEYENQIQEIIPRSALSYTSEDEALMQDAVNQYYDLPLEKLDFDVESIIDIHQKEDIRRKRDALIDVIFGRTGFPESIMPASIEQDIEDNDFKTLSNLRRIDKLTFELDYGLNSICYHFIPEIQNKQAVIYHQGHAGKFSNGIKTIKTFLDADYDVIAISMPLKGYNRRPVVDLKRFGKLLITKHEQISFLMPENGHPVRYFLDPVAGIVNYLTRFKFESINMIGISGGGWTTTIYSALDTRISHSYPVAGSLPLYLRTRDLQKGGTFGDYEQYVPEIYRVVNYLELYILAAHGDKRKHFQILNEYDACCFGGTGYTTYVDIIKDRIKDLGEGNYDFYLDSSHREHKISDQVLEIILNDLKEE